MPDLSTEIHLKMLSGAKENKRVGESDLYGMQWGNPDDIPFLGYVRDRYLLPFVDADKVALEIGPGGGRWTQYLQAAKKLYAVDYHQELLDELARNFDQPNIVPIKNEGRDFPGVADESVDTVFSFGTLVHLELDIIDNYLAEIRRVLKPNGRAILQYGDKTKLKALQSKTFAGNSPEIMRSMALRHKFVVLEEANHILPHSAVMLLTLPSDLKHYR